MDKEYDYDEFVKQKDERKTILQCWESQGRLKTFVCNMMEEYAVLFVGFR